MNQYDSLSFEEKVILSKLSGDDSIRIEINCSLGRRYADFVVAESAVTKITKDTTPEAIGLVNPEHIEVFNLIREPLNELSFDFTYSSVLAGGDCFTLIAGDPFDPVLVWSRRPLSNIGQQNNGIRLNVVYYGQGTMNTGIAIEQLIHAARKAKRKKNERS